MIQIDKILIPKQFPESLDTPTPPWECYGVYTLDEILKHGDKSFELHRVIDVYLKSDSSDEYEQSVVNSCFRFIRIEDGWMWSQIFYKIEYPALALYALSGDSHTFKEGVDQLLTKVNE
jgi:hypothetical protein